MCRRRLVWYFSNMLGSIRDNKPDISYENEISTTRVTTYPFLKVSEVKQILRLSEKFLPPLHQSREHMNGSAKLPPTSSP